MKNNKVFLGIIVFIGAILSSMFILLRPRIDSTLFGMMWGIGFPMFALGLSRLILLKSESKHPKKAELNKINKNDERNILIRHKARAKAGQIQQWLVIGIAYILVIADSPRWIILLVTVIFLSFSVLSAYYENYYQKLM